VLTGPPAVPPLQEACTTALRRRVASRVARAYGACQPLVGHRCARCLDASALWGGELGVGAACPQEVPAGDAEPHAKCAPEGPPCAAGPRRL